MIRNNGGWNRTFRTFPLTKPVSIAQPPTNKKKFGIPNPTVILSAQSDFDVKKIETLPQ